MASSGRRAACALLALLFLDQMLAFTNWWPTPAIKPDARLAPEFVLLWVLLLVAVHRRAALAPRLAAALSMSYLALVIGRYIDTTAPALFGRNLNLYWDAPKLPRFLWVSAQDHGLLASFAAALVLLLAVVLLYRLLRLAIGVLARDAAPFALRSPLALGATGIAVVLSLANLAGVRATWPFVSKPVLPAYAEQAALLWTAFSPARIGDALPASPAFDSDLDALAGADVTVLFVESYGAVAFDHPRARQELAASRERFARQIARSGRQVVSAFVQSPTFGGASDLAHLGLLSGLDLSDPRRHDLLLTTERPTLLTLFRKHGWRTYGLYPALSWDWPERTFYGYDTFIDARDLGYAGPRLGHWWVPDQYTIARFEQLHPLARGEPPRLLFFSSITSHFPFSPAPPYQNDWARVLSGDPFDAKDVARARAERIDWLDMLPGYLRMIDYDYRWIGGWLEEPRAREHLLILVGDHQPTANIAGEGASWEVPVHVIGSDPKLLARFVEQGFVRGLEPARPSLGAMHELTRILLRAFSGRGDGRA